MDLLMGYLGKMREMMRRVALSSWVDGRTFIKIENPAGGQGSDQDFSPTPLTWRGDLSGDVNRESGQGTGSEPHSHWVSVAPVLPVISVIGAIG